MTRTLDTDYSMNGKTLGQSIEEFECQLSWKTMEQSTKKHEFLKQAIVNIYYESSLGKIVLVKINSEKKNVFDSAVILLVYMHLVLIFGHQRYKIRL